MDTKAREILNKLGYREDFDPKTKWMLQNVVDFNDRKFLVSTVDLGLDHSFGGPRPLYYETMIFEVIGKDPNNRDDIDFGGVYQNRYTTKAEAQAHHDYLLDSFKSGSIKVEDGYLKL